MHDARLHATFISDQLPRWSSFGVGACLQRNRFHNQFQYLFIESICNDTAVLEQNYRYKMMYSPDYAGFNDEQVLSHPDRPSFPTHARVSALLMPRTLGRKSTCPCTAARGLCVHIGGSNVRAHKRCMTPSVQQVGGFRCVHLISISGCWWRACWPQHVRAVQAALDDFRDRITRYEEVYETITNRDLHYIKLIDMYAPPPPPARASSCVDWTFKTKKFSRIQIVNVGTPTTHFSAP